MPLILFIFECLFAKSMQHLLISISDSANLNSVKASLLQMREVEKVESVTTTSHWKDSLHLPGPPLSDSQLEELANDMENETQFFTLDEAKAITLQNLLAWKQPTPSK